MLINDSLFEFSRALGDIIDFPVYFKGALCALF